MDTSHIAEHLKLDSKLFNVNVSRLHAEKLSYYDLETSLDQLERNGEKLIYWWSDSDDLESQLAANAMCGLKVSEKLKFRGHPMHMAEEALRRDATSAIGVDIVPYDRENMADQVFLDLSPDLAEHSRFNFDPLLTGKPCNLMFDVWIKNSLNSLNKQENEDKDEFFSHIADHMLVAKERGSGTIIGFITVCRGTTDPLQGRIPLLVVRKSHKKRGMGTALLASALLWAREQCGADSISSLTMAMNLDSIAGRIMGHFNFKLVERGTVWHFWLPKGGDDAAVLSAGLSEDGFMPNSRPFLIGTELENIKETLDPKRIGSAGVFTKKCHAWLESELRHHRYSSGRSRSLTSHPHTHTHTYKALLVGSGTQALEMSAVLSNVESGDEVIMPSYTFVSTANAFVLHGCVPVFVDCREDTLNIDETKIEAAITEKTKAIIVVHYAGIACEMDTIMDIAGRHKLVVVEDAAHSILSYYKGRALGSIGDYGCFSFHYTKNLIAGECGAIAINRPELVSRAMITWEKGTNRYDFLNGKVDKYAWVDKGSSFLPSEITASILWAQFESGHAIQNARVWAWHAYQSMLTPLAEEGLIQLPALPEGTGTNGHIFWVLFRTIQDKIRAEKVLKEYGIQGFSHYVPLHNSPGGRKYGRVSGDLAVTESIANRILRMPIWPEITVSHIRRVALTLRMALS